MIPARQIGWDNQTILYWNISKQLEKLICIACNIELTTTTTTVIPTSTTTSSSTSTSTSTSTTTLAPTTTSTSSTTSSTTSTTTTVVPTTTSTSTSTTTPPPTTTTTTTIFEVVDLNLMVEGHSFQNPGTALPYFMKDYTNSLFPLYDQNNKAVGGATIANVISRAAVVDANLLTETATIKNVLALYIGANDFLNTVGTGTTAYNDLKPYVQARATAGWKVLVYTCTNRTGFDAQGLIERDAFNDLLRSDLSSTANVYILDTDTIAAIDDPSNTMYYSDGLHPTDVGAFLLSELFVAKISSLYGTGALPVETVSNTTLALASTGDGTGIANIQIRVKKDITITVDGNARFYTNSGATAGESNTWTILKGVYKQRWLKCTSGTANLVIAESNNIIEFVRYTASTNAPKISGDISTLKSMISLNAQGANNLTGNLENNIALRYLIAAGTNSYSGNFSLLTNLQYCNNYQATAATWTLPNTTNMKELAYLLLPNSIVLTSANVNQILADFWLNKDWKKKDVTNRTIDLSKCATSGAPTGQGATDKAALQAYSSPTPPGTAAVWTVTTK